MAICLDLATSSIVRSPAAKDVAVPRRDGRAVEGAALEMLFRGNSNEGSNPSLSAKFSAIAPSAAPVPAAPPDPPVAMAARIGPPATTSCEPRQARKGAAAAVASGAGVRPVGVAAPTSRWSGA
ncbi:MAG: hypothetical protein H6R23_1474 [Proteobacteria bacterium]|nr:hypothetical protein [Pseudomonadota bacterium]